MDDISRESSPVEPGEAPVSERQKGPEELGRFERGQVDDVGAVDDSIVLTDRLADRGAQRGEEDRHSAGGIRDVAGTPAVGSGNCGEGLMTPLKRDDEIGPEDPAGPDEAPQVRDEDDLAGVAPDSESGCGEGAVGEVEARAAVDAEAGTASVEQQLDELDDLQLGEDGLPIVPELSDPRELSQVLFVMMLTSREGLSIFRLAQACNTSQKAVEAALDVLRDQMLALNMPVELARVGDTVRWMSTATTFPYLQRLRGVKKLEKLSPAALETLAVIAYRQPVMRSEIEAIRGVKAGPMLRTLLQHKLIKVAGRADVPGRPLQYGTTPHFLERFGLASLQDLPSVKEWKNLG